MQQTKLNAKTGQKLYQNKSDTKIYLYSPKPVKVDHIDDYAKNGGPEAV